MERVFWQVPRILQNNYKVMSFHIDRNNYKFSVKILKTLHAGVGICYNPNKDKKICRRMWTGNMVFVPNMKQKG
ncbi:hypothetical protein HMPREF1548_01630 [Clostridium sp. KLE 1755]|nr:hypothetical protein HMPREF1548_01630 [Clostridium sp. KLE 1755]